MENIKSQKKTADTMISSSTSKCKALALVHLLTKEEITFQRVKPEPEPPPTDTKRNNTTTRGSKTVKNSVLVKEDVIPELPKIDPYGQACDDQNIICNTQDDITSPNPVNDSNPINDKQQDDVHHFINKLSQ